MDSICLDTDILFNIGLKSENNFRQTYNKIMEADKILTEWVLLLFTDFILITTPICIWEFLSVNHRESDLFSAIERTNKIIDRYNASTIIEPTEYILSILLTSSTGVSCADAYVIIYAILKECKYVATNNAKDFKPYERYSKNEVIHKMIEIVKEYSIMENNELLLEMIEKLRNLNWPKLATKPAMIEL